MPHSEPTVVVCAWCGIVLKRLAEKQLGVSDVVSHGICPSCADEMCAGLGERK